jgi:2-iminobutanoate/2-iminopropanoate deaminase
MNNIRAILQASNCSLDKVVQANVYLSSMALFSDFNSIYARYFKNEFPARTTVEATLPQEALVEVSVVAFKE